MSWETSKETLTCGSLGVPQSAVAATYTPAIGTVIIPANTVWEVVEIQARQATAYAGEIMLRDAATTTNIYATTWALANAQVTKGNAGAPIGTTIGPFAEDVTLEIVGLAGGFPSTLTVTALARLKQSYKA